MNIRIKTIEYHRNGISGAPFYAVLFKEREAGRMLGIVFENPYHVAVLNIDKLASGNVTFGQNSWRGDNFESLLRQAIAQKEAEA